MIKVSELIEALKKFPPDAMAYAYSGEVEGIVIADLDPKMGGRGGFIPAYESQKDHPAKDAEIIFDSLLSGISDQKGGK